jgi:hypothetical protein
MPHTTQQSDFWGWYLRHNSRLVWKYLQDAGLDVFAAGPSNDTQAFLDLTNILPAVNGGLNKRWGIKRIVNGGTWGPLVPPVRTFFYNNPQDAADVAHTANTNLWLATNNQQFTIYKDDGTFYTGFGPSNFAAPGVVSMVTSRNYLYYSNGLEAPRKVNPSYTSVDTNSLTGIALPIISPSVGLYDDRPGVYNAGSPGNLGVLNTTLRSGWGYSSPPTVTVTDTNGGTGTGCTITVSLDANGSIQTYVITNKGSGYTQAQATLSGGGSPTRHGSLVLYTQTNPSGPDAGKVVAADLGGDLAFVGGRQYAVALRNSFTGHTSDAYVLGNVPVYGANSTHPEFDRLTKGYDATAGVSTDFPVYAASTNAIAGGSQMCLTLFIAASGIDPQVDTVLLLAGADGQGLSTLYELAQIPLSSFTLTGAGTYEYRYIDTLPDTFTDFYVSGDTLLASNIWAETNSDGTTAGIFLNTPPPTSIKHLTLHQGRMFGTDGKVLFYSKSLDEITTSSALFTSKWEECWPGDYQLPLALNNESVNGIKSDGTVLHVSTEKSIFTVYGSDPSSFSVPSQSFSETGVLHEDCWAVVYAEGLPSGYVWITPDYKVMHSDFSTYREIGTAIYPVVQNIDPTKVEHCKVQSLSQGPYNFVVLSLYLTTSTNFYQPEIYIYETRLGKWYHWTIPADYSGTGFGTTVRIPCCFVYQYPAYTSSTVTPGNRYLFFWQTISRTFPSPSVISLYEFDPASTTDVGPVSIPWSLRTSWQDCGDSTAVKVADEVEFTSDDAPLTVSLYGATSQSQFDSGGVLLKTGTSVTGPMAALGVNKFYLAGTPTAAKYYSLAFSSNGSSSPAALTSWTLETYPMTRI